MYCKNCGKEIKDSAKFCPYCGTPNTKASFSYSENTVNDTKTVARNNGINNTVNSSKSNNRAFPVFIIIVGIFVAIGVIYYLVSNNNKTSLQISNGNSNNTIVNNVSNNDSNNQNNNNSLNTTPLYRVRLTSKVGELRIRSSAAALSDLSNKVGTATTGDVFDVYETKYSGGYQWLRIGVNRWIADDGTWTEIVDSNYVEPIITFSSTRIGDYIFFGEYEQDNNLRNGKEQIQWIILDNTGDKMLLLSRYALDSRVFNSNIGSWNNSSIRSWLNDSFLTTAFKDVEVGYIKKVTNTTEFNNEKSTEDKVFLLSHDEVSSYLPNDYDRICYPTKYALSQGTSVNETSGSCWWWLRSVNGDDNSIINVRTKGNIRYVNVMPYDTGYGVRPAIWVKIR